MPFAGDDERLLERRTGAIAGLVDVAAEAGHHQPFGGRPGPRRRLAAAAIEEGHALHAPLGAARAAAVAVLRSRSVLKSAALPAR